MPCPWLIKSSASLEAVCPGAGDDLSQEDRTAPDTQSSPEMVDLMAVRIHTREDLRELPSFLIDFSGSLVVSLPSDIASVPEAKAQISLDPNP